jgi:Biotin-requiring enzyme
MATEVNLPALGRVRTEGTVTRWLKQVGDTVAVGEPLLEASTDKVDTGIPSPVAGPGAGFEQPALAQLRAKRPCVARRFRIRIRVDM